MAVRRGTPRTFKTDVVIPAGSNIDDLIEGGPGIDTEPREPAGPAMVEVEINGAKYLVPSDSAAAIRAQQESLAGELTRTQAELAAAKTAPAPAALPRVAPEDDDLENELFLNPRAALSKRDERIKAEIRQEYTLEQQRRAWWDSFYTENKHLKSSPTIVEAVMQKHMAELSALPVDKQQAALAAKVDAELAGIVKERAAAAPAKETARPVEQGGAIQGGPHGAVPAEAPDRVISIGQIQRDMRKRRMEARTGRASA